MRLPRVGFVTTVPFVLRRSLALTPAVASCPFPTLARRGVWPAAAVRPRAAPAAMATANGHPAGGGAAAPAAPAPTPLPTPTPATAAGGGGAPRAYGPRPTLVLTNDDGVDPPPPATLLLPLARAVAAAAPAYDVLVVAPAANQSACGMRISLGTPLTLTRRRDLEGAADDDADAAPPAHPGPNGDSAGPDSPPRGTFAVYTLSGSPADAVITAIEPADGLVARRGGVPVLVVSGVNVGPNLGTDVLYSGTFSAARQGGLYGVPAVAVSLCAGARDGGGATAAAAAAALVVRLLAVVRAGGGGAAADGGAANPGRLDARHWHPVADAAGVRRAFCRGDLTLNVNVPGGWAGGWATCTLGALFYRGVVGLPPAYTPEGGGAEEGAVRVKLGGGRIEKMVLAARGGAAAAAAAAAGTLAAAADGSGDGGADGSGDGGADGSGHAAAAAAADRHAAAHALTDVAGVEAGLATVTSVSTWPAPHEAAVGDAVLAAALAAGADGLPAWLAPDAAAGGAAAAADEAEAMRLEVTRVGGVHVGGSAEAGGT